MKKIKPISPKNLRQSLSAASLHFTTTKELKPLSDFLGQTRALEALTFGVGILNQGYNIYAMGPSGIGKRSLIHLLLSKQTYDAKTPSDWCYIHNFITPEKPIALALPAGLGFELQQNMNAFIGEFSTQIVSVFESDEYNLQMNKIADSFELKRKQIRKKKLKIDISPRLFKEQHQKEKEYQLATVNASVAPLLNKIKKNYTQYPAIMDFLTAVQNDIANNIQDLIKQDEKTNLLTFSIENPLLSRYKVNLLVDNRNMKGAPVIYEPTPSYSSLICRIEHTGEAGSPVTNFTLIKAGALHRANGGYLILDARKIKKNKEAWEALKSALFARVINARPIEHEFDIPKPISLDPMGIPLDVKIVLIGDRNTYYSLCQRDPDFLELFKVPVDFDEEIVRNTDNIHLYARLIATIAHHEKLYPFHANAVARIIDFSSRLAEDKEKLSTYVRDIQDLIIESHYFANVAKKKIVESKHVVAAIRAKIHRMDRARDLYYEDIERDFILIKTMGKEIGQVNCLSVRKVGDFSYGHPTRVSARVRIGKGKLIDIQREVKLAGPFHTKAGLIIANFLASRFHPNRPFALYASIAFEQIYCWTDGDSASVGELCALLSALSELPILQSLAVTGSIDQYGMVQAVGGVNEKVEGFFDVCKTRKLSGKQGVLIPAVNQKNLMLREDIQAAAKKQQFFIYPIQHIDDAVSLLFASQPKQIYAKIEKRLQLLTNNLNKKGG